MKNNKDEKIRISIINGFLGSGKTTLQIGRAHV